VDVHHIQPRAEGGQHHPDNLLTLCAAHHRAAHRGELLIEPSATGTVTFRHADGTPYGHAATPAVIALHAKVFSALRRLGFREREVQVVLAELRDDASLSNATIQVLLREALRRVGPTTGSTQRPAAARADRGATRSVAARADDDSRRDRERCRA
jgi:hypothetical protein